MQLNPRYGTNPIVTLDGDPGAIATPAIRQRKRLASVLADFDEDQWSHPSRCAGWSNRDVIIHLDSTNVFWTVSIEAGLRGEPTEFMATFDPVTSPAKLVARAGEMTSEHVLETFSTSTTTLVDLLASLQSDDWSAVAEAPIGHVSASVVVHHALWDSWIHERDVLEPIGVAADDQADEVIAGLRYAAALSPAFAIGNGFGASARLGVTATDPSNSFVVEIGDHAAVRENDGGETDVVLTGPAVDLLEALSLRQPLDQPVSPEHSWMFQGLLDVFDATPD